MTAKGRQPWSGTLERKTKQILPLSTTSPSLYPSIPSSLPPSAALESAEVSQAKTESSGGNYQTDRDEVVRRLPELYGGGFFTTYLYSCKKRMKTLDWFLKVFFLLVEHFKQTLMCSNITILLYFRGYLSTLHNNQQEVIRN